MVPVLFYLFLSNFLIDQNKNDYFSSFRYYSPKSGQFIQPDSQIPRGFYDRLSLNRYLYTFGNPLKYTDPDGHSPQDPADNFDTLRYLKNVRQAASLYQNSKLGSLAVFRYRYDIWKNNKEYRKYLSRERVTGIAVIGNNEIPNAGPKVADALQQLAGDQATINAVRLTDEDFGSWGITYRQNPDHLGNKNHSNSAWIRLKKSLDASTSLRERPGEATGAVFINLLSAVSENGMSLVMQNQAGTTIKERGQTHIDILILADMEDIDLQLAQKLRSILPLSLGHELKHARDAIEGNLSTHFNSPVPYIFYDDPNFVEDILYQRAYNENSPPNKQIPESLPTTSPHPVTSYMQGFGVRAILKSISGVDPSKAKWQKSK